MPALSPPAPPAGIPGAVGWEQEFTFSRRSYPTQISSLGVGDSHRRCLTPGAPPSPPSLPPLAPATQALVDEFYRRVLSDPRLGHFFAGVDMSRHARKFLLFVTYVLGGGFGRAAPLVEPACRPAAPACRPAPPPIH